MPLSSFVSTSETWWEIDTVDASFFIYFKWRTFTVLLLHCDVTHGWFETTTFICFFPSRLGRSLLYVWGLWEWNENTQHHILRCYSPSVSRPEMTPKVSLESVTMTTWSLEAWEKMDTTHPMRGSRDTMTQLSVSPLDDGQWLIMLSHHGSRLSFLRLKLGEVGRHPGRSSPAVLLPPWTTSLPLQALLWGLPYLLWNRIRLWGQVAFA